MATHRLTQGPGRFLKLAAALFGTIASSVAALGITGGHIDATQWVNIGIAAIAAFQVWYVTETSDNPHGKAVIAGVAAALVAVQSFISGGGHIDLTEWMQVGMAALTATGIWAAPSLAKTGNVAIRLAPPVPVESTPTRDYAAKVVVSGKIQTALTGNRREISATGMTDVYPLKDGPVSDEPGAD